MINEKYYQHLKDWETYCEAIFLFNIVSNDSWKDFLKKEIRKTILGE